MRKKCVKYKKYLNCKFCFSFLRNKKLAEMHLINYHPRAYDMVCKKNGVGGTEKVSIGNNPDDCPAGFCEVTLYEPEVKLERLPFKRCGSISTENANVKVGNRTERKSKIRAQSIIQNVISTTGPDPVDNDHLSESSLSHSELKQKPSKKIKSNRRKRSWKPSTEPYVNRYKFSCDKCPAQCYSVVEFDRHISVHNNPTRKLITCLICKRVFNKRDSLNSHIAAHETAEAREENLNLLESWPELPQNSKFSRTRFACKHCLLMCTNHVSFLQHINSEHGDTAKQYSCSFRKCSKTFVKIRELVKHAKSSHPKDFYGKLTWYRMNKGVYNGTKAVPKAIRRKKNDKFDDSDSTEYDSDDEETMESEDDTAKVLNKRALRSTGPLNDKVESNKRAVIGSGPLNIKVESIDISETIPSTFQPPSNSVIVISSDFQTQVKHEISSVDSQNDETNIGKDDFIHFRLEATLPDDDDTDSIIVKQEST